jgi:serine/threonine-protein kinase RsbW
MDHLRLIWQMGETLLESVPFDDDPEGTRYNFLVALQEMVTNVYRHGYRGDDSQPLAVSFAVDAQGVCVTVRDRGPAFDPRGVANPPLSDDAAPTEAGGFGIMIARAVMDQVDYARVDGWNVLTLRKAAQTARARSPAATHS